MEVHRRLQASTGFERHWRTTGARSLFTITGDPSMPATFDPCITGPPQPAIVDGFFMMFKQAIAAAAA
jgi:hypothetical protein